MPKRSINLLNNWRLHNIKISLDPQEYHVKPKGQEGIINNRIGKYPTEITIEDLAQQLVQPHGRTFTPAYFKDFKKCNENWLGQTVFGLDFDKDITFEAFMKRCEKYNLIPAFVYSTFSSINNNRFRAVFQLPFEVKDPRVAKLILLSLMKVFPEADKMCKDIQRMFYGGKTLLYENYKATIDIGYLVDSVCIYIAETDKNNNAARTIKDFCCEAGLDMQNGYPKVETSALPNVTYNGANLYIYYRTAPKNVKAGKSLGEETICIYFCKEATKEEFLKEKTPKFKPINEKVERQKVEHIDFDKMEQECPLLRDFLNGNYWAYHNEIFGLATNLLAAKGGRERFMKGIESRPNDYNSAKWHCANYINKKNYQPQNCANFCPPQYCNFCKNSGNIIQRVRQPRGTVYELMPMVTKSLEDGERETSAAFQKALTALDNKVYVIKAPTGIGKTTLYETLKGVTIALPTHNLKEEVKLRMIAAGNTPIVTPALPNGLDAKVRAKFEELYSLGAYKAANKVLKELAQNGDKDVEDYLIALRSTKYCKQTLVTTHERLLYSQDGNDTVIIDEDILPTLLKQDTMSINDLASAFSLTSNTHDAFILHDLLERTRKATPGIVQDMPSFAFESRDEVERQVVTNGSIKSNVLGFLSCSHFIKCKEDNDKIAYIVRRELPQKKIIILSATANEKIYRKFFGDTLEFIDIGNVETKGKIIQYPQFSFSRFTMRESKTLLQEAKRLVGSNPVITFKEYQKEFPNCVATFGSLAGLDKLSGQDIFVVGTPHVNPNRYMLMANALGLKPRDYSMSYHQVERNGLRFWFNAYSDNDILQEIQLYLVESELVQAIGRARILRKHCTVTVLSNFAIPGAEYKKYNEGDQKVSLCA